ncbi:MAG: tetratricopeptide repeat protein, partial [Pseudomonadota bacterium]
MSWNSVCLASLVIDIEDPQWRFSLLNTPLGATDAQLAPEENGFALQIQPLLRQQAYQAISDAFAERPLAGDSAALQQLRGQILISLKRYEEAETALLAALDKMPDLVISHRGLSLIYMINEDFSNARTHLRRSIELGVADAQLYGQLAYVNLKTDFPASAIAGYQQALYLEPDNKQWQQGLLFALLNSKSLAPAQALVDEMLSAQGQNVSLWLTRSQIALNREDYNAALSSLEIALSLGSDEVSNYVAAAQLHLKQNSYRRAVNLLTDKKLWQKEEVNTELYDAIEQTAAYLVYQNQWNELSRLLTSVTGQNNLPKRYRVDFNVYAAQLAMEEGKITNARKSLEAAINQDPSHGEALLALG